MQLLNSTMVLGNQKFQESGDHAGHAGHATSPKQKIRSPENKSRKLFLEQVGYVRSWTILLEPYKVHFNS